MAESGEQYQPDQPVKTSYSTQELEQIDQKIHQEDLKRQEALKNNPPQTNKRIIGTGNKPKDRPFFDLKPSRPFWSKRSNQSGK